MTGPRKTIDLDIPHDAAERVRRQDQYKGMTSAQRVAKRNAEQDEFEAATLAWVHKQSADNSHRLYTAACTYFGIKPVIPD